MRIKPARRIHGSIRLPGDKSISHRAAIIAALASGSSQIFNFSTSKDCAATLSCLEQLGVSIEQDAHAVRIAGMGDKKMHVPSRPLDCGNSGSTMRMLAGVLACHDFSSILTGDDSLRTRPMKRIITPLEMMGAQVESNGGHPPLQVKGSHTLKPIRYEMPEASAQVKTCVLLAGLKARGRTEVVEASGIQTRDHTERMLEWFGVTVNKSSGAVTSLDGPVSFTGRDVRIPGDFSSAAFLIAAAFMLPGSELTIDNLGLNPTRTQLLQVLSAFGHGIETSAEREDSNEPVGTLVVRGTKPSSVPIEISGPSVAALIDELPLLAVIGTQFGGIRISDAGELRIKESDRIAATVKNLRAMGAKVEEFDDGLAVEGPVKLHGASLDTFGDHRIAMAFSVAALVAEGESEILASDCVDVSFPGFFQVLESIVER